MGSAVSSQVGAALGATAFPLVGPIAVVAARQAVSAVVLLAVSRPPLHRLARDRAGRVALRPALLLGVSLIVMNFSLYGAIDRIGLGLAVTLEFMGPLAVALLASRRPRDLVLAVVAGFGVVLLTGTVGAIDPIGIALGLVAAAAWAAYILLNQQTGAALPGLQGAAVASALASLVSLPLLVAALVGTAPADLPHVLLAFLAAGVLASVVPYAVDLVVLRRLRRQLFGVLQSVHPAAAAVAGLLVLGQVLAPLQWLGLLLISVSNVAAVTLGARHGPVGGSTTGDDRPRGVDGGECVVEGAVGSDDGVGDGETLGVRRL